MAVSDSGDSFVWSDASSDSEMELNIKQEKYDEENEKSYKKQIHENLFQDKSLEHSKKAKKRKHDESSELNGTENLKNKTIKSEPESDIDLPKKKKRKHSDLPNDVNGFSDDDESYLNHRVKLEQESFVEPAPVKKKKKKKNRRDSDPIDNMNNVESSSDITMEDSQTEDTTIGNVSQVKKKKKKDKEKSIKTKTSDVENSDSEFEDKKKPKSKKREKFNKSDHDNSDISQPDEISCIESSMLNNHHLDDDQSLINKVNNVSTYLENTTSINKIESDKELVKISDRLRFEDDTVDYCPEKHFNEKISNVYLKKYLTANNHLSFVPQRVANESILTEDDEIWIIKGPNELDIKDFKDVNIKLDSKSKLKFHGQAYDTVVDKNVQKIPIFSYVNNKPFIQNVPLVGSIHMQKRIPKAHIPEENIIVSHQPSFIPLPETKCRHPLFGSNYKKEIKIPKSVAERLNNTAIISPEHNVKEKKKKHKKEKRKLEVESECELIDEIKRKKKRKKSSFVDEPVAKHIKHESESVDVWDSEQAIEKNLFDF